MSNPIKWNYDFPGPTYGIKMLNFDIGIAKRDYSPTSSTGWWSGITPPTATGYVVYSALFPNAFPINSKPTARYAADDAELIVIAKSDGYTGSTISGALEWYLFSGQHIVMNISDYPNIVTDGLFWLVDPSSTLSYSRGGQYIFDLSPTYQWNEGTLTNGVGFSATGGTGGSLSFDGIDDYVLAPSFVPFGSPSYSLTTFSIDVWFYAVPNSGPSYSPLVASFANYLAAYPSGSGFLSTFPGTILSTGGYSLNTWNNVVFTYDTSTQNAIYYINGVYDSTTSIAGQSFSGSKFLGVRYAGDGQIFKGNMGPVKVYDRAITAAEVTQNYNAMKVRYV